MRAPLMMALLLVACSDTQEATGTVAPVDTDDVPDTGVGAPVDGDGDGVAGDLDCDDDDADVFPGADERCNGADDDCDGDIDEGAVDASTWYDDADGDGYGDLGAPVTSCTEPAGAVANADDCDDGDADRNPEAAEVCNGVDDDCDGGVDGEEVALYFSAATDTVQIPHSPSMDMGASGTIEAWVKFDGTTGIVFNKWTNAVEDKGLYIGAGTVHGVGFYGSGWVLADSVGTCTVSEQAWSHIAFSWDASGSRVHVDGVLCGSDPVTADVWDATGPAHIGGIYRDGFQNAPMLGFIKQVRLSDVGRYTSDFAPGDLTADADTLAFWALDEGAGTVAFDGTAHGADGTISGATWAPVVCSE